MRRDVRVLSPRRGGPVRRILPLLLLGCPAADDAVDAVDTDTDSDAVDSDTDAVDTDTDTDGPTCPLDTLTVAIGRTVLEETTDETGQLVFSALAPGDDLPVVHQPIGSYELPLALDVTGGTSAMQLDVRVVATDDPTELVDGGSQRFAQFLVAFEEATCAGRMLGMDVRLDVDEVDPTTWQDDGGTRPTCPDPEGTSWEPFCGRPARIEVTPWVFEGEQLVPRAMASLDVVLQPDLEDGCPCEPPP